MAPLTMRWEYDADRRIATCISEEMTEGGVRTHMKFHNDAPGIPEEPQPGRETGPAQNAHVEGDAGSMDNDDSRSVTPKVKSESEFSAPEDIYGSHNHPNGQRATWGSAPSLNSDAMSINQWTRRAPVVPNPFSNLPGSDVATEIVSTHRQTPRVGTHVSSRPVSHFSGPTLAPDSVGHAGPESVYFSYQESGMRTYDTEDPAVNRRAQAHMLIQRCDATNRNLGMSRNSSDSQLLAGVSSLTGEVRFVSPAPSGQIPPPSLHLRGNSPMSSQDEVTTGANFSPPVPSFDFAKWKWRSDMHEELANVASSSSNTMLVTIYEEGEAKQAGTVGLDCIAMRDFFGGEDSPLTELDDDEDIGGDPVDGNALLYEVFGHPDSPLTELPDEEYLSDEQDGENTTATDYHTSEPHNVVTSQVSRTRRGISATHSPLTSTIPKGVQTESIKTRRRAKRRANRK